MQPYAEVIEILKIYLRLSLSVHFAEGVKVGQNLGLDREEVEAQMASAEQIQSVGILIHLY